MDWDDEYEHGYGGIDNAIQQHESMGDKGGEGSFDPLDITDPSTAYLFLSDDAQDEITGRGRKKMKCRSCGHRFVGEIYDRRPECFSSDTEEIAQMIDA